MEATKKVGGPDPSGPQDHPSVSSQQLGSGLRGSQGPWISSESLYFKQGLSLSTETITDGACGPASQACIPEPICQLLQDPALVSSRCCCKQASQDAPRLSSTSVSPSPIVGAQQHLIMEDVTLTLPVCTHSDSTSDIAQRGPCCLQLQVQNLGEGKPPAKVLVGWGKGPCSSDQIASLGSRKSWWVPFLLPGENGAPKAQGALLAPAQDLAQDQDQAWATTPALDVTPTPTAVETATHTIDHLTDTTAVTKGPSQDLFLRKCGNQWSTVLESSKMVASCQDKVNLHSKEEPSTPVPSLEERPDHAQEDEVTRRKVPTEEAENPMKKLPVSTSRPGSPMPGPEPPVISKSHRSSQEICSSQPQKQAPNVCENTNSNVPPSAYEVTCHKQSPFQSLKEAMQIPFSSAPTCQLQEAVEDRVLGFDMATGSTRMGLLCHDPVGSRAVLVGLMPSHPSIYVPENMLSTQLLAKPILSPDSNHSSFWSITPMLSSPVPSSLREVALLPKEARLNLESWDSPGTETPIRVGMFTGPVPLGMPLQFDERILSHVPNTSWSKPDGEKNEPSHTIWMLDPSMAPSRMPDASIVQTKKLQWINSEPAAPASTQEVPRSLLQEDISSQEEVIPAHPDNPQAKDAGQTLTGQILLARQPPLPEHPLTDQPPLTGQTPLARNPSLSKEPPITKEPTLSRWSPNPGEPGQVSTQEDEPLGLPTHVGIFQVPLTPEETCIYISRNKVGVSNTQHSIMHQQQPGNSPRAQEEQLPLITFTTPGTGRKVLPMAMVATEPQNAPFKLTAEDLTRLSVVAHLGLPCRACYELVSTMDALPVRSPVLCCHSLGPFEDMAAVVIDTGTGFTKCGLAGEDHVLSVVPSRVQLLQHPAQGQPLYAVPENQEGFYSVLNRGVVYDWDALEVLWQHLFYCRLGVQPEKLAVLIADSPISPHTNREKVAEILFEHFHVPAMQTVHQALLALYAYGRTTGLVLGSGHGTSYVAPILTGDLAPLDTYRLDVAGADLTDYLAQLLQRSGHSLPQVGLINQMKEACCYVAMDVAAERARTQVQAQVNFVLPDKQVITLGSERFCCPEALFQPNLIGLNQPGLPQLALLSISRLEAKQQEQLLANVVLDGGSTLVSGFPERLRQELGPGAAVLGSPHRAVAAWLGGSIMASRSSFQNLWLSRREYEEEGPWAIYKYQL